MQKSNKFRYSIKMNRKLLYVHVSCSAAILATVKRIVQLLHCTIYIIGINDYCFDLVVFTIVTFYRVVFIFVR